MATTPMMFNTILAEAGLQPTDVRLLRHQDTSADGGRGPYELFHNDHPQFEMYQSIQTFRNRTKLKAEYWAAFIVNPDKETMFAGVYRVKSCVRLELDTPQPHIAGGIDRAGTCDRYDLVLDKRLKSRIGKLFIDWGPGHRAWIQCADRQNKRITRVV